MRRLPWMRGVGFWSFAGRTLIAPWVVLPTALLAVMTWVQRGLSWRGDVISASAGQAIPVVIVGILLMAAVAVDTARAGLAGRQHDLALTRPRLRPYQHILLVGATPTLLMTAGSGLLALGWAGSFFVSPAPLAAAAMRLVTLVFAVLFFACLGSLVGRVSPPLVAGLLASIIGLGIFLVPGTQISPGFRLLDLGVGLGPMLDLTPDVGAMAAQIILFAGASAACVLVPPRLGGTGATVSAAAAVVLVPTALLCLVTIPGLPPESYQFRTPSDPACKGASPTVCLMPEHEHLRPMVAGQMDRLVRAAEAAGVPSLVPRVVTERAANTSQAPGGYPETMSFLLEGEQLAGVPLEDQELIGQLLIPPCPSTDVTGPSETQRRIADQLRVTWSTAAGTDPLDVDVVDGSPPGALDDAGVRQALQSLAACR